MPDIQGNRKKVYSALAGMGFTGIGKDADEFSSLMDKEENRKKVYDALSSKGFTGIGKDYNEFSSLMYSQPLDKSQHTFTAEQLGLEETPYQFGKSADKWQNMSSVVTPMGGEVSQMPDIMRRQEMPSENRHSDIFVGRESERRFADAAQNLRKARVDYGVNATEENAGVLENAAKNFVKVEDMQRAEKAEQQLRDEGKLRRGVKAGFEKEKSRLYRGAQHFVGEAANLLTGSSLEAQDIIERWDELTGLRNDATAVVSNSDANKIKHINELVKELGSLEAAKEEIEWRANNVTWGDRQIQEASRIINNYYETEGVGAWVGGMIPQMIPAATGMLVSAITKSPTAAKWVGRLGLGGMSMSTAGQSMKEARDYGADNWKVWAVGLGNGAIEMVTEAIPYNRYTKRIANAVGAKVGQELSSTIVNNPSAREELEKLLVKANKELGGNLLGSRNVKDYLTDVAAEGASEFTAEALQTITPMLYQNPEDYPTLWEVIKNGWEGAKGGIFMGSILGGVSKGAEYYTNDQRRKTQGYVRVAEVNDGKNVGIGEVVGEREGKNLVMLNGEVIEVAKDKMGEEYTFSYPAFKNAENLNMQDISFEQGYNTEPTGANALNAMTGYDIARQEVARALGLAEGDDVDVFLNGRTAEDIANGDEVIEDAVNNYLAQKARMEGIQEKFQQTREQQYEESDRSIQANDNNGMVYATQLKDEPVFITGGNVVLNEDGTIDVDNSSETLYVKFPDGHVEMTSPDKFTEVFTSDRTADLKAAKRAEIDAKWKAEFDAAEAQSVEQESGIQSVDAVVDNTTDNVAPTGDNVAPVAPVENNEPAPVELPDVPDFFRLGGTNYEVASRNDDGSVDVMVDGKRETLPAGTDYSTLMPTDKKGDVIFTAMPVERTHEYFVQKVTNDKARALMIEKNRKKAEAERKKFDKDPDVGLDPDKWEEDNRKWEEGKKAAQAKVDYWNEVAKRDAEITRSETREAVENIKPDVVEETADEFIANQLAGIKITPESFKNETGLSNAEQAQLVGVISNDGVSVERAAEIITENYDSELKALGFTGDMQDVRDIIIDFLSQGNPRSYARKGREVREAENVDQQRAEAEVWARGAFDMTLEELYLYEETLLPRMIRDYKGFDENEYYSNLAENNGYDTTRESESIGRGSELLQGEQPVPAGGTPVVGQRNEGGAVSDDVQGGGQDGVAQEEAINEPVGNSEQLSSSEIPNNQSVAEGSAPGQSGVVDNNSANALQNGNNELNLQKENESDNESNQNDIPIGGQVSQPVPQGEHGTQTSQVSGAQEVAARLRERIESAQGDSKSGLREVENRVTREFAQENGLWIENETELGTPFPSGDEHNNYIDAENQVVYKVNNRMHTPSILDLLDRIEQHNKYFPDSKYSLVGFTSVSKNGDVLPVFAQDFVSDARMATVDEIDSYMGTLGFTRVGDGRYSNGEVVIKDLKPRNVLADADGDIYVVDAEFEQENSVKSGESAENGGESASAKTIFSSAFKDLVSEDGKYNIRITKVDGARRVVTANIDTANIGGEGLVLSFEEMADILNSGNWQEKVAPEPTNPSGNRLVTDESYAELRERMRKKLKGQMNIGIDPEILAIGTEMAVYHIEKGARKFADFAKGMIADLGDAIRPYLKAFYNGARELPEIEEAGFTKDMTPYEEVKNFDVANFGKPTVDAMATAETVTREAEVAKDVEAVKAPKKRESAEGKKLRKATQEDLEGNPVVYYKGEKHRILMLVHRGEQTSGARFTKPEITRVYLENMQDVKVDDLYVEDTGEIVGEKGDNSVPSQQTPVNNLNENNDGREENTATDNSGAQFGREELPDTEQVGAGVPVQDTARNSKSKRRNAGVGSSELGNGPQYDVNRNYTNEEIEEIVSSVTDIVDGKVVITGEVTDDIKAIVRGYESGGIAKKGRGILDEYYTDGKIVDAVNLLIAPYFSGSTPIRVLEPSVGIGNFIQAVNNIPTSEVVAFEINETTARIAKILYPDVDVNLRSFETEFIDESGNKKPMPQKYSLVIGNPPYGSHRGLYKGLGEESKIARYEDYFVKRSLDVLDEGGVLAMVLPSSWMDRHTKFGGYTIERAYRLPSGAFEATQVGTDIVILKKDSTVPVTEHAPYFEQFPERVLGEVKQRKGRYGRLEEYVEGDIDAAIEAIKKENAEQVADLLDIEKNNDALNDIESAVDETGSPEKAVAIVKDAQESEKADKKPAKKPSGKQGKYKVELNRGVETVPTSAQFTHEFSEGEVEAFADTDYEGALSNPAKHRRYANYIGGQAIHDFYYAEGDIYSKLAQLEQEKDYIVENYGVEQYEKQKALLESVLPKQKSLEEITISPNTTFVKNLNILTEGGRVSLKDMFVDFLRKLPHQAFGESSPWEVIAYINNEQVHGTDKSRNQRIRERRKRVANDLFNKFLSEELSDNAKKQVVAAFNREYNSTYRPDYSKVPMFSTINRDFKGKPLKLTSVQLAGIGRMTVKGVGLLAHEVGFGKTLSGILAMHEAMTRGFAKKPLIVVPNDNILKQWVETIGEVLPNATVNTLGNLGAGYDLTDFKVNDGEFTIITYEGLKAMSFSDGTYNHLASKFSYITEDLNKHQSERDIQKEIEKKKELKGKMKRGTKPMYLFEDFGFDWLTVDEVHNANHIVSKVRLDKSVASDFRSQSQRTSDLGLKTWLAAQYIQEENNGRNVLLLSATPFTNKPLEYYSILSLVGNDMLERKGFFNVDQFFATFMEADNELEIGANGRPTQKTNVRRFRNNGLFQQLLSEFIDIKGEEDNPELVRPERLNKEYKIAQNELTAEAMAAVQELLSDNDTVLQGIGHARAAAFSPYATSLLGRQPKNHVEFVRNSPKIDATIKMIEQNIKDRPDAGQIIYSEVGVEYFPLIRDYLVKESGLKPSEVRIITGATSNNERVNIQTAFNNGEVKVVIGSPAIKEGLNLQGNTTDMYILSLPWNFTQLRQIEGRGWRQGNRWENIRINYMLTDDSVDVFMLQRLQLKQGLYNEAMKSGAESLDVSDIDTAELKTALITDPAVRAEIVTVQEREKLQLEKMQIEADLSFVMRKYEAYNKLVEILENAKRTIKMYREWAQRGDEYWAQGAEREEAQLPSLENEIEEEKQNLLKKGVNVDDIVRQTEQAQNAIAAIQEKIDNLKEFQEELTQKFREESEAKAKEQGDLVSTYIKERKAENKGGFYKIRPQETETKAAEENTEDDVAFRQGSGPLTDREVVMESDVYSKVLGKPRYYGQKQRNYVARQRAKMAQKATELAEKLNTPIEVRETAEGLTGKKAKAKGWYDVKSGNIVVVVSNHGSIEDIQATVLHEVVAHKGLRQMFGEHFDTFLDNVYNNVDAEIRAEIDALTEKYGNTREATEEYLASLAENTYFEKVNPSLWSRIKQWFLNMLTEAGIKLDFELSDNELRYILWRSHQRLVNPGIYNPVTRITDVAVRARLGIGEYAPAVEEMAHVAEEDTAEMQESVMQGQTMFRIADDVITTVDDFNSTHKGAAPTVIIDSADTLEEQLRAEGFSKEDIAESLKDYDSEFAYYHPTYDKVVINDHDVPKDELIGYLWHENAHRAVRELYTREEMERLCDYIYKNEMPRVREVLSEMGYKPEELAEEAYVRGIEDVFSKKDSRRRLERGGLKPKEDATEEEKVIIDSVNRIVDFINNGREEERADGRRAGGGYAERSTQENRRGQDEEVRNSQETGENTQAEETRFRTVEEVVEQQEENEVRLAKEAVTSLGENLNSPVKIIDNIDSVPENRRKWKGWFDPETGEVVVVMPNHVSTEDALQTVLHEVVGHRGLRAVLGEDFDGFLDGVYKNASQKVKRGINDKFLNALKNGPALTVREATEEYIAELAERDFEGYRDTWNAIRQWFRNFFRNFMNMEITDGELRYLLWKNYNRMKSGPIETILDRAMEANTGTGKVMPRTAETFSAVDAYNKSVKGFKNKFKEGWYDEMRSVRKAQEAIEKELGRELLDSENVYLYANHIPSINKNKKEVFDNKYLRPFTSLLEKLYKVKVNGNELDEKAIERYTNAKHGIERNREMSVKNALTEAKDGQRVFNEEAYKSWAQERDEVIERNLPWAEEQRELDKVAEKYGAKIRDYSGLTAIFDTEKKLRYKKIADAAYQYVEDVENALGDDVKELWGLLKGMTDYSLNEAFESGLMSKSTYEHIKQMYRYYVPLRGFTEETAEDFFDYVEGDHSPLNAVVKTAYGRKSEADNIFATILNMANSAIVQGSKNRLKQRLLNLAMRSQTGLLSVDNAWYAKNGDTYTPVEYPENANEYADFEERMKDKEKRGEVVRHRPGLDIGRKVAETWNKTQHAVRVKRNGREYVVWVNGDPAMANAINGLLREEIGGAIKTVNQFRSKMVTQYSPTFVFTNLLRDVQSASIIYAVRRGTTMLKDFEKNVASNATDMMDLYLKYKRGTLDVNNPKERYFKEFLENGGETGYTEMISIEEYEKKLKELTTGLNMKNGTRRAFKAVGGAVDFANRCVENLCRFSAYQTSREAGISILKSIEDAKEVSVNFNRKGSGAMGQKYAKAGFMFLNPAVQSIAQRILLTKKYPKKMAAVWAGEFILGAAMPVLYSIISAALGDDDDEITGNYYNLSDYRRRSSLCLPLKDGVFHIPLSHESRVLFGLGELCTSVVMGHEKLEDAPIEALNTLAQSLPLNPVEGWMPGKNIIETMTYNFMPDAVKPIAEVVMNRDFAGNTVHNRTDFNEFMPEYMRGKRGTSGVYKTISKYLTSTDGYEKSFLNNLLGATLNPSVMEHLVEGYLGGLYTFGEKAFKAGAWAFGNEEYAEFRNIPIASSFYTSLAKYEDTPKEERTRRDWENAFRFYKDEVKGYDDKEKTAKNGLKYGEEGADLVLEQMERNGEVLMVDIFNDGNDRLKELYGESDVARKNNEFDKVEEIDQQIYAEKRNIASLMELLADDPMIGYTFKRNKIEGPYGERETYGDVRDAKIINDIQKELKPLYEEYKDAYDWGDNTKEEDLWYDLDDIERDISDAKSEMKDYPEDADELMAEIRELRAKAMELINNYRKDE